MAEFLMQWVGCSPARGVALCQGSDFCRTKGRSCALAFISNTCELNVPDALLHHWHGTGAEGKAREMLEGGCHM